MYLYNIRIVFFQEIFRDGSSVLNTATEGRAHFGQVIDIVFLFLLCVFFVLSLRFSLCFMFVVAKVAIVVP